GVLWAGKEREVLADWQERFAAAGITLVVAASRAVQDRLEDKAAFLADWDEQILPVPRWQAFGTPAEFEAAYAALPRPGVRLCIKPARGIYASGFRVLEETPDLSGFLAGSLYTMSVAAAREMFSAPAFPTMLLMEVLEGAERSVDCVAWRGRLIRAVVRRKFGAGQVIEDRPDLVEAARQVAGRYQLSGIFNFQTKDQAGVAHMLEINARASGGLRYSMASGVNFLRLGLDAASGRLDWDALPEVRTGFQVFEDKAVRVVPGLPLRETGRQARASVTDGGSR
ncbi:MAG: ATP-grasp domain-containing protein, partial [Deinococcus sp.]|nr:ATP-grasp domain-containing protein [Deinococcus sp.]